MAYQEFYCDAASGNIMNGGYPIGGPYPITYTNGSYNSTTNVFDPAGAANPLTDGVAVGDYVSIYNDGATTPVWIARVSAVSSTTFTVTGGVGTEPTTSATGRSAKVGGAWKGPNGNSGHPFDFITSAATDASGNLPRVNFKNGTTYNITAGIDVYTKLCVHEGYATTTGDGGKAIIDGGTTNDALLTISDDYNTFKNLIIQNNTSGNHGIVVTGAYNHFDGVVVNSVVSVAFLIGGDSVLINCEAYSCDIGFYTSEECVFVRCIAHNNIDEGFYVAGYNVGEEEYFIECISDTNGGDGIYFGAGTTSSIYIKNCTIYNNSGDGIDISAVNAYVPLIIENCIISNNGNYGIRGYTGVPWLIVSRNNAFYNNTSGQILASSIGVEIGTVTLTGDPFVDAANGDFRLNNTVGAGASCRGAGYGTFTQTASSYSGSVSYPDIGACQHQEVAGLLVHRGMVGGFSG